MLARTRSAATVLVLVLLPAAAGAWGGRLHVDINRAAANAVPDEMAAWRPYDRLLAPNGIRPDLWKGDDPTEGPRHYIDLERYRGVAATNLPRDYAQVDALTTRRVKPADGIGPWVVMELQRRLTLAMASNEWTEATRLAAAMGHYVADLHQPLHTTENFDNADVPGQGAHIRWEDGMPKRHWRASMLSVGPAAYLADPWTDLLQWVEDAHKRYEQIYDGDREALRAADGYAGSREYYEAFWNATRELFISQASKSATHLASLWYTAWVDAGRPLIPPPPEEIPTGTVWMRTAVVRPQPSAWPFLAGFAVVGLVVVILSIRRSRPQRP